MPMNRNEAIEALAVSLEKITSYRDSFVDTDDFDYQRNSLLTESIQKLKKLSYILNRCYQLDDDINALPGLILQEVLAGKGSTKYDQELVDKLLELDVYCEAFYYTAFRVYKIHEELKIKFLCVGVRDVRNHLIEHPEVLSQSIGTGNVGNGPTIKNARQQGAVPKKKDEIEVFQDKGLFINYEEFIGAFDKKASTLLEERA